MKREIAAGLVLLLLAIGSWFNLNYLREFTGGLEEQLALSRAYCYAGRFDLAEEVLSKAADEWLGADGYVLGLMHSQGFRQSHPADYDALVSVLEDVADGWRAQAVPFWAFITVPDADFAAMDA